jgi:hypothetical protein
VELSTAAMIPHTLRGNKVNIASFITSSKLNVESFTAIP